MLPEPTGGGPSATSNKNVDCAAPALAVPKIFNGWLRVGGCTVANPSMSVVTVCKLVPIITGIPLGWRKGMSSVGGGGSAAARARIWKNSTGKARTGSGGTAESVTRTTTGAKGWPRGRACPLPDTGWICRTERSTEAIVNFWQGALFGATQALICTSVAPMEVIAAAELAKPLASVTAAATVSWASPETREKFIVLPTWGVPRLSTRACSGTVSVEPCAIH